MATLGLQEGTFKFYVTDAAGNLSGASTGTITVSIPACSDSGTTVTCSYTGDVQKWVVPSGITAGRFTVTGAAGGGATGGFGGIVTGTLALTAGQTLYMYVGQAGSTPSLTTTFNGGGSGSSYAASGGGATDIRTDLTLANRLVVAGGGGGASNTAPGADAGFTSGANAVSGYSGSTGGSGGTQSAGGTGGTGAVGCGPQNGSNGALGIGGNGATASSGGAGGGGGYYGGGGGGSGCNSNPGGGGSGYVSPTLVTGAGNSLAATRTNGSITIIYVADTLATPTSVTAAPTGTAPSGTLKSIALTWAAVTNASSYTIKIYDVVTGGTAVATINSISSGATSTTITTSQYAGMLDKTTYYISVTAVGNGTTYLTSLESSRASVTTHAVASAISIASQPASQQKTVGQSVTFTVSASATDQGTLSYVWKKGATTVGTNSSTYTFTTTNTSDAGNYTVIITNTLNGSTPTTLTSSIATLTMSAALTFNARSNVTITAGTELSGNSLISVTASNGRESRTYAVSAGSLPAGLSLDSSTGIIGGTATATGTFSGIKITVTDANSATLQMTSAFSITVNSGTQLEVTIVTRFGTGGSPLTLVATGGSGGGSLTYALSPLHQPSCSLVGPLLTANFGVGISGSCSVVATRAGLNGFTDKSSAPTAIYFTAYVPVVQQTFTCPAGTIPSAPSGIGVGSCSQVLAPVSPTAGDSGAAPKITALSATSGLVGATITITGTGFSTVTRVQFGTKSTTTFTATSTTITVAVPTGATRGRVMVVSPTGTALAAQIFTVTALDTQAPGFTGGSVNTSTPTQLTLNFDEAIDGTGVGAASFAVLVGGTNRAITGITISGTTITLTLSSAVTTGQTVDFTYTSPGDSTSIKDAAGNKTATITSTRLTNNLS
jgi:hypothetical protein